MKENNDTKGVGIKLLKKGKRGIFRAVFSRIGMITILLLVQIGALIFLYLGFESEFPQLYTLNIIFTVVVVFFLLNSRTDSTVKVTWLIVISLVPVFGALLYAYTQSDLGHRALKKRINQLKNETKGAVVQSESVAKKIESNDAGAAALARYIRRTADFPIYDNTEAKYFGSGEEKFEEMLIQLRGARKFIFLEYFIVAEGEMWGRILEILAEKAAQGVEVRLIYDGTCEFAVLPHDYPARLQKLGIKCKIFAPITPFLSTHYNYRDHRKILVIDGHTAFTGGINLADEYINKLNRFGHWKDSAVMLKGEAVKSFTLMFLQMWAIEERKTDFEKYLSAPIPSSSASTGFFMPYSDCPLDGDKIGERVYVDILNRAKKYVHIMTPYLILDGIAENALKYAAERGVDVAIILPGIPDKKAPYALAKTHYKALLDSGVRIYEYTPGFVHSKIFVADDKEAVVGTINLDYRSFYHHFECAAYMYDSDCIADIENDFDNTVKQCRAVSYETLKKEKLLTKIQGFLLKAVAPLL